MLGFHIICYILIAHFLADFIAQPANVKRNKYKLGWEMGLHIVLYGVCLLVFGFQYAVLNAVLHWLVDMVTSQLTHYLSEKERWNDFFIIIGLDQLIHTMCLIGTYVWLA